MGEKVTKAGVKREKGYLYFLDKDGDISRAPMSRGKGKGIKKTAPEKVQKTQVKKESGYLYYIDKDGDVCKAKLTRGR